MPRTNERGRASEGKIVKSTKEILSVYHAHSTNNSQLHEDVSDSNDLVTHSLTRAPRCSGAVVPPLLSRYQPKNFPSPFLPPSEPSFCSSRHFRGGREFSSIEPSQPLCARSRKKDVPLDSYNRFDSPSRSSNGRCLARLRDIRTTEIKRNTKLDHSLPFRIVRLESFPCNYANIFPLPHWFFRPSNGSSITTFSFVFVHRT